VPHTHLDELDEPVGVIILQIERSDADGEVDVRWFVQLIADYFEYVERSMTAL